MEVEAWLVCSPIEGGDEMIEKTRLAKYPGGRNAVGEYHGGLESLRSQSKRNVVQEACSLRSPGNTREWHRYSVRDWNA